MLGSCSSHRCPCPIASAGISASPEWAEGCSSIQELQGEHPTSPWAPLPLSPACAHPLRLLVAAFTLPETLTGIFIQPGLKDQELLAQRPQGKEHTWESAAGGTNQGVLWAEAEEDQSQTSAMGSGSITVSYLALVNYWHLSHQLDGTKLSGAVDGPEGWGAIHRDLDRLEN